MAISLALLSATTVKAADYKVQTGSTYRVFNSSGAEVRSASSASAAIQWAVDNSGNGGTVTLARGSYPLSSPVMMRPGVTLTGKGRGTALTLAGSNRICVRALDADNSTISHLAVTNRNNSNGLAGIQLDSCEQCQVTNVITLGFDYGIHVMNGSRSFEIDRSTALGATSANIYLQNIGTVSGKKNLIDGAAVFWGKQGLASTGGNGLEIVNSMFHRNKSRGIDVVANDVLLTGSRVFWNEDDGVRFRGNNVVVTGNVLTFTEGNNITFDGVNGGLIKGNSIIDSIEEKLGSFSGLKSGLVLSNTRNVIVEGNPIYNWHVFEQGPMLYGIFEDANSGNNTIRYNTIHYWHKVAIQSNGSGTNVHHNTMSDPAGDGRWLLDMDDWDNVCNNFVEQLYNASPSRDDYVVRKEGSNYRVYNSIGGSQAFSSTEADAAIQWAIDNTTDGGGEVLLQNGTYPLRSKLELKRYVWLRGQGPGTVLQATGGQDRCIEMRNSDLAVLSDLKVVDTSGVDFGIYNYRSGLTRIQNIWVEGFDTGIEDRESVLTAIDSCRLKDNITHIQFNRTSGMHSNNPNDSIMGRYVQRMATRNILSGGTTGISVINEAISINLTDNIFIKLNGSALKNKANATMFVNNTTYQIKDEVIDNSGGGANHDRELTVVGNLMSYHEGHAISTGALWGTIVDNVIRNTGVGVGNRHGLFLNNARNYVVLDNSISNESKHRAMADGVRESGAVNVIANNTISGYAGSRVNASGSGTIAVGNSGDAGTQGSSVWVWDKDINPDWAYETLLNYIGNLPTTNKPLAPPQNLKVE